MLGEAAGLAHELVWTRNDPPAAHGSFPGGTEESAGGRGIPANSFRPPHREDLPDPESPDRGTPLPRRPGPAASPAAAAGSAGVDRRGSPLAAVKPARSHHGCCAAAAGVRAENGPGRNQTTPQISTFSRPRSAPESAPCRTNRTFRTLT